MNRNSCFFWKPPLLLGTSLPQRGSFPILEVWQLCKLFPSHLRSLWHISCTCRF
jgi:hypothetical protein